MQDVVAAITCILRQFDSVFDTVTKMKSRILSVQEQTAFYKEGLRLRGSDRKTKTKDKHKRSFQAK